MRRIHPYKHKTSLHLNQNNCKHTCTNDDHVNMYVYETNQNHREEYSYVRIAVKLQKSFSFFFFVIAC